LVQVHENVPLAGQTLADSNFRRQFEAHRNRYHRRRYGRNDVQPPLHRSASVGDILIVLGDADVIDILRKKVYTP
jgi:TrkA-C domain.